MNASDSGPDEELLPCPCCGDEAEEIDNGWPEESGHRLARVRCTLCAVGTDWHPGDEARRRWESRVEEREVSE